MENKKNNYKYIAFAAILSILLIAWAGANKLKYDMWPWQMIKQAQENYNKEKTQPKNGMEEKVTSEQPQEEEKAKEQSSKEFRQAIMKDLSVKIKQLSPVEPVLGGQWFVDRFWFASDRDIYIEYEDGHILRRILVKVEGAVNSPEYQVVAYFEPGESDWELKQGQDTMFGKPLNLYEYDEGKNEWTKRN